MISFVLRPTAGYGSGWPDKTSSPPALTATFSYNRWRGGVDDGVEREFFIDNLLVRIYLIIEMIWLTGLAPWEFEFPFPGSRISAFLLWSGAHAKKPCAGGARAGGVLRGRGSVERERQVSSPHSSETWP